MLLIFLAIWVSVQSVMYSFFGGDFEDIERYRTAALSVNLNWKELYAIDALRYDMDFSKGEPYLTALLFIEVHPKTGQIRIRYVTEVALMLGLWRELPAIRDIVTYISDEDLEWNGPLPIPHGPNRLPSSGLPVPGYGQITSFWGTRLNPVTMKTETHKGIDFAATMGAQITSVSDGVVLNVVSIDNSGGYGILTIIDHGNGVQSWYAHQSEVLVHKGAVVKKGQVIGKVGTTGQSTGPHLHLEVRMNGTPIDPLEYLIRLIKGQGSMTNPETIDE